MTDRSDEALIASIEANRAWRETAKHIKCSDCGENVTLDDWQEHGWAHIDSYMGTSYAQPNEKEEKA